MLVPSLHTLRRHLTYAMTIICLMIIPHAIYAQSDESLSNAELYRLISQLEQEGQYHRAAEAYRIIAERDLAEIENLDRAIKNYIEAQKLLKRQVTLRVCIRPSSTWGDYIVAVSIIWKRLACSSG